MRKRKAFYGKKFLAWENSVLSSGSALTNLFKMKSLTIVFLFNETLNLNFPKNYLEY